MGSVFNRGTKDRPVWYGKYKERDGRWRMFNTHQATKADARDVVKSAEQRVRRGQVGIEEPDESPLIDGLMREWMKGLTNRSAADDRSRINLHLLPVFGRLRIAELTLKRIMEWLDTERAKEKPLSSATLRHNLNLLSRFFGWAIERDHAELNPVRQIPQGKRPQQSPKRDVPWLEDDAIVRKLMAALPAPVGLAFYIGNRSGLRLGELCGLRLSDLAFLGEGLIRVRFSYDGPLKEDKGGTGRSKWAPAPDDAQAVLGPWLTRRQKEGATPEAYVFPRPDGSHMRKEYVEGCWERAAKALGLELTFYAATRHSFVSRNLARGISLDEVSAAVGHSSPVVTRRFYDHYVRRSFSAGMRQGIGGKATAEPTPEPSPNSPDGTTGTGGLNREGPEHRRIDMA